MALSSVVTTELQVAARTALRAILQENDPTLDISVGGAVDSILVEGNVAIAAQNQVDIAAQAASTQLSSIADGTVTVTDEAMDAIASSYFITRSAGVAAYGPVEIIVSVDTDYTIPAGYRFNVSTEFGNVSYVTTETYTVYATSGSPDLSVSTNRQLFVKYDTTSGASYRFVIEASCSVVGPTGLLATGAVMSPVQTFTGFARAAAGAPFSGGTEAETNAELATRALAGITPAIVAGVDSIQKLANSVAPLAQIAVVGSDSALVRPSNNVLGLNAGGKIDVFVKSGAITTRSLRVTATVTDYTNHIVTVTLPAPNSYGVYSVDVTAAYSGATPVLTSGGVVVQSTTWSSDTRSDFNPYTPTSTERRFSANATVTLTVKDDRQTIAGYVVSMPSNGVTVPGVYDIVYTYMPDVSVVADAFYAKTARPPGVDVLVKACVPCYTAVTVTAAKPVGYSGETATQLAQRIAAAINAISLGTAALSDYTIRSIISQYGSQLTIQSVTMSGTITGQDGTLTTVAGSGGELVIPTSTVAKFSSENTGFIASMDTVVVTFV